MFSPKASIEAPSFANPEDHETDDPRTSVGEPQVPAQQVLPKNSDQHARGAPGFIKLSTDTYNSLETDLAAAKKISMELLNKHSTAKRTIRALEWKNRKLMIQAQIILASSPPLAHVLESQFKAKAPKKNLKIFLRRSF